MKIINHGSWTRYVPDQMPKELPANIGIIFCRRDSDGVDWYQYIHGKTAKLKGDSIKVTVLDGIVRAASRDASMLFPQNCTVLELIGDNTMDAQTAYGGKLYDARTNMLAEAPPQKIEPSPYDLIKQLAARIEALERK
jgi:hypothetical protein